MNKLKFISLCLFVFLNLNLNGQTIQISTPNKISTPDMFMFWWFSSPEDLKANDDQNVLTEVCAGEFGSGTLFLGDFNFVSPNLENSTIYLNITKRKDGSDIRDSLLFVTYNDQIISGNLADSITVWPDIDSTFTYALDLSLFQISLDEEILNDSTFGFLFKTTPADPFCMNPIINSVELVIEEGNVSGGSVMADAGPVNILDCNFTTITLGGSNTSMGVDFTYEWFVFGSSISNQPFVEVSSPGTYILTVTNNVTNEVASDIVSIPAQLETINLRGIESAGNLTCSRTSTTLELPTINFEFPNTPLQWQTVNGNIISDPTQNIIEVDEPGEYTVVVTNPSTGCTSSGTRIITQNIELPFISIVPPAILSCIDQEVLLDASNSSSGIRYKYSWFDFQGNLISNEPTILVSDCGEYTLMIENTPIDCIVSATVLVECDTPSFEFEVPSLLSPGGTVDINSLIFDTDAIALEYTWTTVDGNIVSGQNESTITVDQPGEYCLSLLNTISGCNTVKCVVVEQENVSGVNVIADAGPDRTLSCDIFEATLGGSNTTTGENIKYEWSFLSPVNFTNIIDTTAQITINDGGLYILSVTDCASGMVVMDTVAVEADQDLPVISIVSPEILTCASTASLLDGSNSFASSNDLAYAWFSPDLVLFSVESTTFVSDCGAYTLEVVDLENGCSITETVIVECDFETPDFVFEISEILIPGGTVDISGILLNQSSSNVIYNWSSTLPSEIIGQNTNTITINQPATYCLEITDTNNGCTFSNCVEVELATTASVIADAGPDQTLTCRDSEFILGGPNTTIGENIKYEWVEIFVDNVVVIDTTAQITVEDFGIYILSVTNCVSGILAMDTVEVSDIRIDPIVNIANPDVINCANTNTLLIGSSSSMGPEFSYTWLHPDGSPIGTTPDIFVSDCGVYTLIIEDLNSGCVSIGSVIVECDQDIPEIAINASNFELNCLIDEVFLEGSITTIGLEFVVYTWTDSQGSVISNETSFTVFECGEYILTVTNLENGCEVSESIIITCDFEEPISSIVDPGLLSQGGTLDLEGAIGNSGSNSIIWFTDDGNIISDIDVQTITIDQPGTYCFEVTNTDNGCTAVSCIEVEQNPTVTVIADAGPDAILNCSIISIDLCFGGENTSEGPEFTYEWTAANGEILSNERVFKLTNISMLEFFPFTLLVTNTVTGEQASDTIILIEDTTLPEVTTQSVVALACNDASVILSLDVVDPDDQFIINWTTSNGIIISDPTQKNITVTVIGTYMYEVIDPSNGCSISGLVSVILNTNGFDISIAVTDVSCFGLEDGSIDVFAVGGTPPYTFDIPALLDLSPGEYTVSVTDASGCMIVGVGVIGEPDSLTIDFIINTDNQLEAIVTGGVGGYTYDWNVEADSNIVSDLVSGTEYELTVTDANGCELTDTFIFVLDAVFSPTAKEIGVFPNPTDGLLQLQLNHQASKETTQIQIFDIQGIPKHFARGLDSKSNISLDLGHLQAGAYILQVVIDGELYYQKIIVF